jgi:RNA polymerase sigma factor for flagellar operon FliA
MPETPEGLFLANRAAIESVIRFVCRRRGLRGDDADEFAGEVRLKLVESNYEILRKFEGRSRLDTYLTVVITRLALDYQSARWGRWRPSAVARSAGPEGIRLEQLVVRDGLPLADAIAIVERECRGVDRGRLEVLASRFPLRVRRQYVGEEILEAAAADAPDAERLLVHADEAARFERVKARLAELLSGLSPADRLVLQLRFEQNMKVADIARLLHTDQKRLYRRIDDMLEQLRIILESEGLDVTAVRAMLVAVEPGDADRKGAQPVRLYERNTP